MLRARVFTLAGQINGSDSVLHPGARADGVGTNAGFNKPIGIGVSPDGSTLFVADCGNNLIRTIDVESAGVRTLVGCTKCVTADSDGHSSSYRDGVGTNALLSYPSGFGYLNQDYYTVGLVTSHDGGTLYFTDVGNNRLRKVDLATHSVSTIAGGAEADSRDGMNGIDGIGTAANFDNPTGLVLSHSGDRLFVVDSYHERIRQVVLETMEVTTIAGNGLDGSVDSRTVDAVIDGGTTFYLPSGVTISADGDTLYVVDFYNSKIRAVDVSSPDHNASTFAGPGTAAERERCLDDGVCNRIVEVPADMCASPDGASLYVLQGGDSTIVQMDMASGSVRTIAGGGGGQMGYFGGFQDGIGTATSFNTPMGIGCARDGRSLYVADSDNNLIRRVELFEPSTRSSTSTEGGFWPSHMMAVAVALAVAGVVGLAIAALACFVRRRRAQCGSMFRAHTHGGNGYRGGQSSTRRPALVESFSMALPTQSTQELEIAPAPDEATSQLEVEDFAGLSLVEPVGQGGFATVWKACWQGNLLAVKVFSKVEGGTWRAPDIAREVTLLRRLRHPCMVTLFGLMQVDQHPALVLEYMAGGSLAKFLFSRAGALVGGAAAGGAERGAAGGAAGTQSERTEASTSWFPTIFRAKRLNSSPDVTGNSERGPVTAPAAQSVFVPSAGTVRPLRLGDDYSSSGSGDPDRIGDPEPSRAIHGAASVYPGPSSSSDGSSLPMARETPPVTLVPPPPIRDEARQSQLLSFSLQLASGLCFLHSHGFSHRDVKTDNALLDALQERCKLADFGLSSLNSHTKRLHCGTLRYVAPELASSWQKHVDSQPDPGGACAHSLSMGLSTSSLAANSAGLEDRADVYAFGMLLYELAHEQRAYTGLSGLEACMAAMRHHRPAINVPPNLEPLSSLMRSCWAARPEDRPAMDEVLTALEQAVAQLHTSGAEAPADKDVHRDLLPSRK